MDDDFLKYFDDEMRYLREAAMESVWDMSVSRQSIPREVRVNDEYYPDAQSDMTAVTHTNPDYPALMAENSRRRKNHPTNLAKQ